MSMYADGEVISLYDEGHGTYCDEIYVKGHVKGFVADEAYRAWWRDYGSDHEPAPDLGPWKHAYARWSTEHWEGRGMVLRFYSSPGRGRFRVTRAEQQAIIDERAERKRREEVVTIAFLARYPGTTITRVDAWRSDHPVSVWFDVPGTRGGAVLWRSDDSDHVSIRMVDLEFWNAYKKNNKGEATHE